MPGEHMVCAERSGAPQAEPYSQRCHRVPLRCCADPPPASVPSPWLTAASPHPSESGKFIPVGIEGSGLQELKELKISIPDKVYGGIISKLFSEISAM